MLTEPAPNRPVDGPPDSLDVVVFVLVVRPRRADPDTRPRRRDDPTDDDDDRLDALWRSRCSRR